MHADPSRATARLPDTLAPSCHERPPTGLVETCQPRDANLGDLCGLFRGYGMEGASASG
jgi:hypothetical protein